MLRQPRPLAWFTVPRQTFLFDLLDDEFTTSHGAPLSSPRTCEPGPGTLTLVQNDGQFSISGAALQIPAQSTPTVGDLGFYSGLQSRNAGRALLTSLQRNGVGASDFYPYFGWRSSAALPSGGNNPLGVDFEVGDLYAWNSSGAVFVGSGIAASTSYVISLIQRGTGGFVFIKGGVFSAQTLLWVYTDDTSSSLAAFMNVYSTGGTLDDFRIIDLPSPFNTDYGIASVHTSAVSGSDYSASADGIFDLVISAPGTLANTAGLKFRKNGGDYWQAWFNSSGNLLLQRFAANVAQGSATTLASSVIPASGTRTLRVITRGTGMDFYTLSGTTWTRRVSSPITDSVLSANSGINPFADSGWSLGQVDAFAGTSSLYNVLDSL